MKNRIDSKFKQLEKVGKNAFIAFITAGDPSLKVTEELVLSFEKAGVDIVELGVPFSDPLADGTTIQAASERALKNYVNLDKIFSLVSEIRRRSQIPIALMTYYNPVFHYGEEKFLKRACEVGVDGVIVPDLPPEEALTLRKSAKRNNIATIFFLSPTTTLERAKNIIKASTGFIYYVSVTGVTGARQEIPKEVVKHVIQAKRLTHKPICVGFGISENSQVKQVGKFADGVIVGSAIVNVIAKHSKEKDLVNKASLFVEHLIKGK